MQVHAVRIYMFLSKYYCTYIVLYRTVWCCISLARPDSVVKAMNRELGHVMHIAQNHDSGTHMWNSSTLGHYLDFLKEEPRSAEHAASQISLQYSTVINITQSIQSSFGYSTVCSAKRKRVDYCTCCVIARN